MSKRHNMNKGFRTEMIAYYCKELDPDDGEKSFKVCNNVHILYEPITRKIIIPKTINMPAYTRIANSFILKLELFGRVFAVYSDLNKDVFVRHNNFHGSLTTRTRIKDFLKAFGIHEKFHFEATPEKGEWSGNFFIGDVQIKGRNYVKFENCDIVKPDNYEARRDQSIRDGGFNDTKEQAYPLKKVVGYGGWD